MSIPVPPPYEPAQAQPPRSKTPVRWIVGVLLVSLLSLVAINKGFVIAALVDGKPIFNWQLNSTLRARYGKQTLEGMIGEALIAKEAQKQGVSVSAQELDAKKKEILSSLGSEVSLSDFLKFQGLTESDFTQQLRLQLTVERLLTKNLTITDDDINAYIATNRATLVATEASALKEEARKAIINNVVSEKLQPWFLEVRQKANVMKFL